jgi:protein-L-isoaspartate(D-aspartate) O-methyltransferase
LIASDQHIALAGRFGLAVSGSAADRSPVKGKLRKIWCNVLPLALLVSGVGLAQQPVREDPEFQLARARMARDIISRAAEYPGLVAEPDFVAAVAAIAQIPRQEFIPAGQRADAYRSGALMIGYDQTISDAYVVAVMTAVAHARSKSNVLEVGTGSGYQAAVLSRLGAITHSIEILRPLASRARRKLKQLGLRNISIKTGDGFAGWPTYAPFDAIIVTAGASAIPAELIAELRVGGRLVMPIGAQGPLEQLVLVIKQPDGSLSRCSLGPTMFVPLTGKGERAPDLKGLYDRSLPLCYKGQTAHW